MRNNLASGIQLLPRIPDEFREAWTSAIRLRGLFFVLRDGLGVVGGLNALQFQDALIDGEDNCLDQQS